MQKNRFFQFSQNDPRLDIWSLGGFRRLCDISNPIPCHSWPFWSNLKHFFKKESCNVLRISSESFLVLTKVPVAVLWDPFFYTSLAAVPVVDFEVLSRSSIPPSSPHQASGSSLLFSARQLLVNFYSLGLRISCLHSENHTFLNKICLFWTRFDKQLPLQIRLRNPSSWVSFRLIFALAPSKKCITTCDFFIFSILKLLPPAVKPMFLHSNPKWTWWDD